MARYAVVNENGDVVNCIEWDGVSQWAPPKGHIVILSEEANRFDKYDHESKTFTEWHKREDFDSHVVPNLMTDNFVKDVEPTVQDLMERIASLEKLLSTKPVE